MRWSQAKIFGGERGEQFSNWSHGRVEAIHFRSLFAVLGAVDVSVPLERQEQFRHQQAGIAGFCYTTRERINGQGTSGLADENAILDAAFLAPIGAEQDVLAVNSDAGLCLATGDFVEQIRR